MTYKQFLVALENTPRDWRVTTEGAIRRGVDQCPISSLERLPAGDWRDVAERKLPRVTTGDNITIAADYTMQKIREDKALTARRIQRLIQIRRDLLKACGLAVESGEKQ